MALEKALTLEGASVQESAQPWVSAVVLKFSVWSMAAAWSLVSRAVAREP